MLLGLRSEDSPTLSSCHGSVSEVGLALGIASGRRLSPRFHCSSVWPLYD